MNLQPGFWNQINEALDVGNEANEGTGYAMNARKKARMKRKVPVFHPFYWFYSTMQ